MDHIKDVASDLVKKIGHAFRKELMRRHGVSASYISRKVKSGEVSFDTIEGVVDAVEYFQNLSKEQAYDMFSVDAIVRMVRKSGTLVRDDDIKKLREGWGVNYKLINGQIHYTESDTKRICLNFLHGKL